MKALFFCWAQVQLSSCFVSHSPNCAVRLVMFLVRAHPEELLLSSHLPLQSSSLHNAEVTICILYREVHVVEYSLF